nr:zinc ABC transporter substrate-binding protein [Clostridium chrysemydis]
MQKGSVRVKKFLSVLFVGILALSAVGCSSDGKDANSNKTDKKIKVVASIYPLEQFTKMIGKDKVEVKTLVGPGLEPHDFDLKPQDTKELMESNIFVYNGLDMEHWADDVINSLKSTDVKVVTASEGVNTRKEGDTVDPHVWLSLKEAEVEAKNILNALVEKDPSNKDYYETNYKELVKEFDNLYNEYKPKFEKLKNKDFITNHEAFGYLCREFGLTQKSVSGIFQEGEPTPQKLQELVNYCKKNNIKVIFSESTAEQKTSETLAKEVGAKVQKIYTLESEQDSKTYLEAMKYNLETIYNSLLEENK